MDGEQADATSLKSPKRHRRSPYIEVHFIDADLENIRFKINNNETFNDIKHQISNQANTDVSLIKLFKEDEEIKEEGIIDKNYKNQIFNCKILKSNSKNTNISSLFTPVIDREKHEAAIRHFTNLGYPKSQVEQALQSTNDNIDQATNLLQTKPVTVHSTNETIYLGAATSEEEKTTDANTVKKTSTAKMDSKKQKQEKNTKETTTNLDRQSTTNKYKQDRIKLSAATTSDETTATDISSTYSSSSSESENTYSDSDNSSTESDSSSESSSSDSSSNSSDSNSNDEPEKIDDAFKDVAYIVIDMNKFSLDDFIQKTTSYPLKEFSTRFIKFFNSYRILTVSEVKLLDVMRKYPDQLPEDLSSKATTPANLKTLKMYDFHNNPPDQFGKQLHQQAQNKRKNYLKKVIQKWEEITVGEYWILTRFRHSPKLANQLREIIDHPEKAPKPKKTDTTKKIQTKSKETAEKTSNSTKSSSKTSDKVKTQTKTDQSATKKKEATESATQEPEITEKSNSSSKSKETQEKTTKSTPKTKEANIKSKTTPKTKIPEEAENLEIKSTPKKTKTQTPKKEEPKSKTPTKAEISTPTKSKGKTIDESRNEKEEITGHELEELIESLRDRIISKELAIDLLKKSDFSPYWASIRFTNKFRNQLE